MRSSIVQCVETDPRAKVVIISVDMISSRVLAVDVFFTVISLI